MSRKKNKKQPEQASRFPVALLAAVFLPLVGFTAYSTMRQRPAIEVADAPLAIQARNQDVTSGGIVRPKTDVMVRGDVSEVVQQVREMQEASWPTGSIEDHLDELPVLDKSMNANVKNTIEAIETGTHPERLTPVILPKKFDLAAYKANPQAYLDVVEPGRVFQSAQPGRGVPTIGSGSSMFQTLKQGEAVRLRVLTEPGAPVSWTSFDLGAFDNHLPLITKAANEEGWAEATFTATTGTTGTVNILAASPVASGRVEYVVTIQEPQG